MSTQRLWNCFALVPLALLLVLAPAACVDKDGPAACNPEYCPQGCIDGRCQGSEEKKVQQAATRTIDILFVVDNSNSMCEEQFSLQANFATFIENLALFGANFRLAVVNTDMSDTLGGVGRFRTTPGSYQANISKCSQAVPDLSYCNDLELSPYLSSENYRDATTWEIDIARLQREFACIAMTGIDGDGIEMGLETMSRALTTEVNPSDFLRPHSMLAIVFVADENDCSDNTFGELKGEVYATGDAGCEYNRNIEDSCLYARNDLDGMLDEGPTLTHDGVSKTARQWCREGDPKVMSELQGSLALLCPSTGCTNRLKRRLVYYQTVLELVARRNGLCKEGATSCQPGNQDSWPSADKNELDLAAAASDVIVAAIINPDRGVRFLETQEIDGAVCGDAGTAGYRYQLFAEMFPENRRVIFPICEDDLPTSFGTALQEIATIVGKGINSVCLRSPPTTCTTDEHCPAGQTCADTEYLAGSDYAFRLCSGFAVSVDKELPDGSRVPLVEGVDYRVNYTQCTYLAPLGLSFLTPLSAGENWLISYPTGLRPPSD